MGRDHLLGADDLLVLHLAAHFGGAERRPAQAAFVVVVAFDHAVASAHEDLVEFRVPRDFYDV